MATRSLPTLGSESSPLKNESPEGRPRMSGRNGGCYISEAVLRYRKQKKRPI